MKKETKQNIGILIVSLTLILGSWGMLFVVTRPADGDEDPPETRDDYTHLVPITENATTTITVNHSGNATVMQTYNPPYSRYLTFDHAILIEKDDLLNNYERVYLYVMVYKEYPHIIRDEVNMTSWYWMTVYYSLILFTSDGTFTIAHQVQDVIIDMTTNDSDIHATVDSHDNDNTTYTFHYPKIIGWEDP